jgi:hypothetical protein
MMARKKLVLECGVNSLDYLGERDTPLRVRIEQLQKEAGRDAGIDLQIVPYAGSGGAHRGGRLVRSDNEALPGLITILNSAGIPFIYAMNGGLLFDETVLPDESEARVLDVLAACGNRFGLKNKVVITRGALLRYLRRTYPVLEVVASCIQQTSPRECGPYDVKLREYDYVVPLNQHTTYDCLKGLGADADRLIVFLMLTCGAVDTRCCYGDYLAHERISPDVILQQLATAVFSGLIPSRLSPEDSGCNWPGAALNTRLPDLTALIRMGVNKFKVTRAQHLLPNDYQQLIELIQEHQAD